MNYRMILNSLGKVSAVVAAMMVVPATLALCLGESSWWTFLVAIAVALAVSAPLIFACKPRTGVIFAKEGFIIVAFAWLYAAAIGALPFVLSGEMSFIDAFFEMSSGFSTTGATVLSGSHIEALYASGKSLLFWRSFTHWIGGMGIIVFVLAVTPVATDRSMHVLRAEMPGPSVDKIVPKARDTAKILYIIYIVMTVLQAILLLTGGMPLFDSVVISLGTAGTGGFGVRADSIASYNSFCQWVITVFMLLFAVNFNVYFLIIMRKLKAAFSSQELWIFVCIVLVSCAGISVDLYQRFSYTMTVSESIRHAAFQTASFVSTTGYSTIPASGTINVWPALSRTILFLLMFVGGCAGSTAGGLKVSRVAIICCSARRDLKRILHPRNANVVKFEGKTLTDEVLHGATGYLALYFWVLAAATLLLCLDGCNSVGSVDGVSQLEANLSLAASCLNNIGPAYGMPAAGCGMYNWFSKLILSIVMLMGRLELYPLILAVSPGTWIKK